MLAINQLKLIFPNNKDLNKLLEYLNNFFNKYEINTKERMSAFLSQCGHESNGFTVLKENLNYSAEALCKVWPSRFKSLEVAKPYHRNPEKIANKVYANRMGNGDENSGDGWKYRGRGAIQLTGKENYLKFSKYINKYLDDTVEYLETLEGAVESACWYWKNNNLNDFADKKDMVGLSKKINGGTIGMAERIKLFNKIYKIL